MNAPRLIVILSMIIGLPCAGQLQKSPVTVKQYEDIIKYYRYYKPDSAVYFAQQAIDFARKKGDSVGVAQILLQQGMIDDNEGKFDNSEKKYQRALELFKSGNSKKGIASATIRIGVVQLRNGNYDKATGNFLQALKTSEASRDTFGIMEATYSISWAYLDQNKFGQALQYLKTAEQYNQRLPFSNISLNIYNHFGVVYTQLQDFKKAEYYLEKGIRLSKAREYQGLNITMINNLASAYAKQGHKDKAIALQEKALADATAIGNYLRQLQVLNGISRTYGKDDPEKAIFYLQQAVSLANKKGAHRQELRYLKNISDVYKATGDYKNALVTKERELAISDSFFYGSVTQNIEALKSEYELEKSNARIKELSYINNKRQLELKNSRLTRNVTFGGVILLLVILGLMYNQYRIKQRNNQEVSKKNLSLEKLVEEKEWLMKEIHHRVKNNMQVVMSLLNTQSAFLENDALTAIRDSQRRMQAMSLIHQKLYQTDNVAFISMPAYIKELAEYLGESYDTGQHIRFDLDIEPIDLDIAQAVPAGLILNEAITNAIKYAFPNGNNGVIHIFMKSKPGSRVLLGISDDGIGLPAGFNSHKNNSLGMSLMQGLVRQLEGVLSIRSDNGLSIQVEFPHDKIIKPAVVHRKKEWKPQYE